ncbi:MAG: RDD family protein [Lachnospiraceae bacterium]|nr:RDD family protein [Lachnospiraceae bacterium]
MDLITFEEASRKLEIPGTLIKYYVEDGLLASTRDGSKDCLSSYEYDELCRIVLLQTLGISIADIRRLQSGDAVLPDVLKARIDAVMGDPNDITQSAIVCQNIRLEKANYRDLQAMPHLEHIKEMKAHGGRFPDISIPGNTGFTGNTIADADKGLSSGFFQGAFVEPDSTGSGRGFTGSGSSYVSGTFNRYVGDNSAEGIGREPVIFFGRVFAEPTDANTYMHPFMRYGARLIDLMLYMLIITCFIRLIAGTDPISSMTMALFAENAGRSSLSWMYIVYAAMFLIEPLLLHFFGTTPGKLIFGVRIMDEKGGKLSLKAAYIRSFRLWRYGFGFMIPFYSIYRYMRSFMDCRAKLVLPWDLGTAITRPEKPESWRLSIFIPAFFAISFLYGASGLLFELPRQKAPLTEEAFYENVAYVTNYNSISTVDFPEYKLNIENGTVTGVSFEIDVKDADSIYAQYYPMYVAFMAFSGAQKGAGALSAAYSSGAREYFNDGVRDFVFEYAGTTVRNEVEYTGYNRNILSGYLYKNAESEEHQFKQSFSITLN